MLILGIETSCDETAASLVRDGVEIVSNVIASSQEMHKKTGGIIPEQAAREQIKCILPVIDDVITGFKPENIDAIAVTYGPGLIGSLLVGIETAKTLAYVWKKPIVPINHLVGHIYANFVNNYQLPITNYQPASQRGESNPNFQFSNKKIVFPIMALIVSGGHTELVLMKRHGNFQVVGQTRDDAAGEAFDKIARLLKLGYPGGPAIQKSAENYQLPITNFKPASQRGESNSKSQNSNFKLPRPMMNSGDLDFSFSGLKTAVLRLCQQYNVIPETRSVIWNPGNKIIDIDSGSEAGMTENKDDFINYLAYETQEAITDVLVKKTLEASKKYQVKTIMLAGGVAANKRLRNRMVEIVKKINIDSGSPACNALRSNAGREVGMTLSVPPPQFCTDNAVGIASAGFFNYKPIPISEIIVDPGLEII